MIDQHRAAFREEAGELLAELEDSLLLLESAPGDPDLIGRVFRAMHTIKGSGAMFGFDQIAAFTHDVETVFDLVRKGDIAVSPELIALTLRARDQISAMLAGGDDASTSDAAEITAALRALIPSSGSAPSGAKAQEIATPPPDAEATYRIRFRPPRDIFRNGGDPGMLVDELREMGRVAAVLHTDDVPFLDVFDPEDCFVWWDVILTTTRPLEAIRDVFMFVDDGAGCVRIDLIDDGTMADGADLKIGEILVHRGDVAPHAIESALERQKYMTEFLVEDGAVTPGQVQSALLEQQALREQRAKRQQNEAAASIRVPAERLDVLVNLVGELVTVQARFSQTAGRRNDSELVALAEEVERLTWALRDNAMNVRMLPIGTTFSKFKRLVHDLSRELGKEIELVTEGAETELDKTVLDRLADPLVHVIRNAIDHGIETPDARAEAGKPRTGTVHLSASHSGANVLLRIRDDGAGLDKDAIRTKAVERGLIASGADLPEKDLFNLIMLPGFSTAKKVTNVSGRGVGMDVVRQALEALGGSIDIDSRLGTGTTFTIKLPLTLAIIDGLLVTLGPDSFVLPLAAVQECIELTAKDLERACGRHIVAVRGQVVPYVRLRELFCTEGARPSIEQIVIAEIDGHRVGFVVDKIVGQHQTVIKSLGRVYRGVPGVSGSTILGDGSVALILDLPKLLQRAGHLELAACS